MKKGEQNLKQQLLEQQVIDVTNEMDLIEIVELIRHTPAQKLYLVLSGYPDFFEKLFELRLLRQNTLLVHKELILVTVDPLITQRARRLGLTVEATLPPEAKEEDILAQEPSAPVRYQKSSKSSLRPAKSSLPSLPPATSARSRQKKPFSLYLSQAALFLLIFLGLPLLAYFFWPASAIITIETKVSSLRVNVQADLDQSALKVDLDRKILPLEMVSQGRTLRESVIAQGRVEGLKASGIVEIYNCSLDSELVVDSETLFVKDSLEFVWLAADANFVIPASESQDCQAAPFRALKIEALRVGEAYNLEAGSYQIMGLPEGSYDVRGQVMSGGLAVGACYTPDDLEAATERFNQKRNDSEVRRQLAVELEVEHGLIPLEATFQVAEGEIAQPATCPVVTENQITQTIIYYLGGIEVEDVEILIAPDLKKSAGELSVIESGLEYATYDAHIRLGSTQVEATVQKAADLDYYVIIETGRALGGVILDEDEVLDAIIGIRANRAGARLRSLEGVKTVHVDLSPRWRLNLPEQKSSIIIKINNGNQDSLQDGKDKENDG